MQRINEVSMDTKVVKYLDTEELSENMEEFKVKKNLSKSDVGENVPWICIGAHLLEGRCNDIATTAVDNEVNTETGD